MPRRSICCSLFLGLWLASAAWAGDWNQFRGPTLNGVADEPQAPLEWSADKNVRWKVPLPRPGNGSPIVAAGRVFVACAEDAAGKGRSLYCFDRTNGAKLWSRTVNYDGPSPTHDTNPYCGSTPACDGERVVVWQASAGLHCYDLDGQPLWSRDLGTFEHMWGYGNSPIVDQGRVFLYTGPGKDRTFVTALDIKTGQTIWSTEEAIDGDGEKRNPDGKYMGSWTTPLLVNVNGQQQLIVTLPKRVVGYDAGSGDILWWCEGLRGERGDLAYSNPLTDGRLLVTTGGYQGPSLGVQLGARGDLTNEHRLWRKEENPQSIGSGILLDDVYYMSNAGPGTLQCLEARTGKELWTERGSGDHWGSMVLAAGRLYATSQNGTTLVFRPNREKLEKLATNSLGERCNSTPAFSNGQVFIRTFDHLYCLGGAE